MKNVKENSGLAPLSRRLKEWALRQERPVRRRIVMAFDLAALLVVMAGMTALRIYGAPGFENPPLVSYALLFALPPLSVAAFRTFGLYRFVTRHIGLKGIWRIGYSLLASITIWALGVFLIDYRGAPSILPRTVVVGYFFTGWLMIVTIRWVVRWWMRDKPLSSGEGGIKGDLSDEQHNKRNVLIYGAGESGMALYRLLKRNGGWNIAGFLDDDSSLGGMKIEGCKVHHMTLLSEVMEKEKINEVIIAIPSLNNQGKRRIINLLEPYSVKIRIMPAIEDIASGRLRISDIREIDIRDLIARSRVRPHPELLSANIAGKTVMVTGAGGSIGSELARQVLALSPSCLVLVENSELALYRIEEELEKLAERARRKPQWKKPALIQILGSAGDERLMRKVISSHEVKTIYHAAAYKHIPILERNIIAAAENNVLVTAALARLAQEEGVERFVLISSDKAVRPANVKGATNRMQEFVIQALARQKPEGTIFTAVRFGNVLDSSGSVVPKFREQIASGGPVTVTHPEAKRYFMLIPEAAELVIQAGALAENGELFALDMGEPQSIVKLARKMIHLAGKEVLDENNPDGDIEIVFTGLRPGDKMREDVSHNDDLIATRHPFIHRLNEPLPIDPEEMLGMLDDIRAAVRNGDFTTILKLLSRHVEGFETGHIADHQDSMAKADKEIRLHNQPYRSPPQREKGAEQRAPASGT